jgi:predicted Zn-dependent protease
MKPDSVSAAFNFAGALLQTGKYETAAVVSLKTLQSHPDNQGLKLNASSALMACRNPKAAERILRSIREPSDPVGYYYNLGECLRLQDRREEALNAYKSALASAVTDSQKSLLKKKITRLTLNLKRK